MAHAHADPSLEHAGSVHPSPTTRVTAADRWLLRAFLGAMGNPAVRMVLWNGESICTTPTSPTESIRFLDRRTMLQLVYDPELAFGEAYSDGRLEVEGDLLRMLRAIYDAESDSVVSRILRRSHRPRANSLAGSRTNIHRHYD